MQVQLEPSSDRAKTDLGTLYRENHGRLRRAVMRLGAEADVAEDLVQLTFLVAHQRLMDFEARSTATTWLFGILFNLYRNHRRAVGRMSHGLEELALRQELRAGSRVLAIDAAYLLDETLAKLDSERRHLLLLWLGGMSVRQIARHLEISVHATHSQLTAARRRIRRMVGDIH